MTNETNMELMNEVAETGAEIVNNVTTGNNGLKNIGIGAGLLVAGALVCKGIEMVIDFGKSKREKRKQKKNEEAQTEASNEKAENVEG